MSEKDVIEMLERFAKEYPDGFSADVLKVIRDLKAELEEAKAEAIKKFAKYIIDKCANCTVEISDLPDFVVEAIQEQNSDGRI